MAQLRARYTGKQKVVYRWVGGVGSGRLVHAQAHPAARVTGYDTWSDDVDPRIPRSTLVDLPVGLLVLDSERSGGTHAYTAGILDEGRIDWSRASYRETKRVDRDPRDPKAGQAVVHVIDVDGVRGEYREEQA